MWCMSVFFDYVGSLGKCQPLIGFDLEETSRKLYSGRKGRGGCAKRNCKDFIPLKHPLCLLIKLTKIRLLFTSC